MISVIIRARNEERWIAHAIRRVLQQTRNDVELILVDNDSTDKTVARAVSVCPDLEVVSIGQFKPGRAINEGIRRSHGEYLVMLSAHCLPVDDTWLESLVRGFEDPEVAGVYGRQIPMAFSSPLDKRDLLVTFGLDRRLQRRDPFFHNANSMIARRVWEEVPFDEEVTNIEDRVWGQRVLDEGYVLLYEPEAPVYHYHGIHQREQSDPRSVSVVRIMEQMRGAAGEKDRNGLRPEDLEVLAVISARAARAGDVDLDDQLLRMTRDAAIESSFTRRVVLATDSPWLLERGRDLGLDVPFLRPSEMSASSVRVDTVLGYTLRRLEDDGYFPDVVVPLEVTYPFRPPGLIDDVVRKLVEEGLDTVIAGFPEYRPCWKRAENGLLRLDDFSIGRSEREPLHVGLPSLGCATYPEFIRRGTRLGERVGILEIHDPIAAIEIREAADLVVMQALGPAFRSLDRVGGG